MFTTPGGQAVELDDVEAVTVRPLTRPAPADDPANPDDRDQAAREIGNWSIFPFEVEVLTSGGPRFLFGAEARDFIAGWMEQFRPWIR